MIDEEAIEYVKYAAVAYSNLPDRHKVCREDFIQNYILTILENSDKQTYGSKKCFWMSMLLLDMTPRLGQRPVMEASPFSALLEDDDDNLDFIPQLSCTDDVQDDETDDRLLSEIIEIVYPNKPELQERLLDYLYGSIFGREGRSKVANMRKKLFNKRFIILRLMHDSGYMPDSDYDYYYALAEGIDKPIRKALSNNPTAVQKREYLAKRKKESHT